MEFAKVIVHGVLNDYKQKAHHITVVALTQRLDTQSLWGDLCVARPKFVTTVALAVCNPTDEYDKQAGIDLATVRCCSRHHHRQRIMSVQPLSKAILKALAREALSSVLDNPNSVIPKYAARKAAYDAHFEAGLIDPITF